MNGATNELRFCEVHSRSVRLHGDWKHGYRRPGDQRVAVWETHGVSAGTQPTPTTAGRPRSCCDVTFLCRRRQFSRRFSRPFIPRCLCSSVRETPGVFTQWRHHIVAMQCFYLIKKMEVEFIAVWYAALRMQSYSAAVKYLQYFI